MIRKRCFTLDRTASWDAGGIRMAAQDMRRKLQWLLVSRLVVAGALLLTVSVIEKDQSPRSFLPVLMAVTGVTALLSGFYFLALRTRLPHRALAYIELTLDVLTVTWLVARTGDVESPFLPLYLVILFAACALLGNRGVLLLGALCELFYIVISVATMSGLIGRGPGWPEYLAMQLTWQKFMFSLNLMAIFAVA